MLEIRFNDKVTGLALRHGPRRWTIRLRAAETGGWCPIPLVADKASNGSWRLHPAQCVGFIGNPTTRGRLEDDKFRETLVSAVETFVRMVEGDSAVATQIATNSEITVLRDWGLVPMSGVKMNVGKEFPAENIRMATMAGVAPDVVSYAIAASRIISVDPVKVLSEFRGLGHRDRPQWEFVPGVWDEEAWSAAAATKLFPNLALLAMDAGLVLRPVPYTVGPRRAV